LIKRNKKAAEKAEYKLRKQVNENASGNDVGKSLN